MAAASTSRTLAGCCRGRSSGRIRAARTHVRETRPTGGVRVAGVPASARAGLPALARRRHPGPRGRRACSPRSRSRPPGGRTVRRVRRRTTGVRFCRPGAPVPAARRARSRGESPAAGHRREDAGRSAAGLLDGHDRRTMADPGEDRQCPRCGARPARGDHRRTQQRARGAQPGDDARQHRRVRGQRDGHGTRDLLGVLRPPGHLHGATPRRPHRPNPRQ